MNALDIINEARAHGVELWAEGGAIRYRGDTQAVGAILPSLKAHKPELLRLLAGKAASAESAPAQTSGPDLEPLPDTDQTERLTRAVDLVQSGHRLTVEGGHLVAHPKNQASDSVVIDPDQGGPIAHLWNCWDANGYAFEVYFIDRVNEASARRLTPEAVTMEPVFPTLAHQNAQNGAIQPEQLPMPHSDGNRGNMGIHGGGIPLVVCGKCQHFQRNQIGDPVSGLGSCRVIENPPGGLMWPRSERRCGQFVPITTNLIEAVDDAEARFMTPELARTRRHLGDMLMGRDYADSVPIDGECQRIDDHTHASEAHP